VNLTHLPLRLILGLTIATLPLRPTFDVDGTPRLLASMAFAESGSGSDGDGDSGSGGNSGGGSNSGSGSNGSNDGDNGNENGGKQSHINDSKKDLKNKRVDDKKGQYQVVPKAVDRGNNLHLQYSNGWEESVANGRYTLVDPQKRTVADRKATQSDFARMRAVAGY
jgi:hypothetical protein